MTIFENQADQPADKRQRRRKQNQNRRVYCRRDFIRILGVGDARFAHRAGESLRRGGGQNHRRVQ